MKLEDIKVGMRVEVKTEDGDNEYEGEVGFVNSIDFLIPFSIEVDLGHTIECFRPEDLEEFGV